MIVSPNEVVNLRVVDGDRNIFSDLNYVIPMYQRPYAWTHEHLEKLVDDIADFDDLGEGRCYYMGSLVVFQRADSLEIIDGQQRLTSLYLLLNCLGLKTARNLRFSCRESSDRTLVDVEKLVGNRGAFAPTEKNLYDKGICNGIRALLQKIDVMSKENENFRDTFIEKLSRVVMYCIVVPKDTDLNRYFEIMNTRGAQLEHHEILKAKLMDKIGKTEPGRRNVFAAIWDACCDMNDYVQQHFGVDIRENLFGNGWNSIPSVNWTCGLYSSNEVDKKTIKDIIGSSVDVVKDTNSSDESSIYEGIIDFPYFLLHSLKVFVSVKQIKDSSGRDFEMGALDDKRLIPLFDQVMSKGFFDGSPIVQEKFAEEFLEFMLVQRFLFDSYFIKRKKKVKTDIGTWNLEELGMSISNKSKSIYHRNPARLGAFTKRCLMLESAMRVSYTAPKQMHWITEAMEWLYRHRNDMSLQGFEALLEHRMKRAVYDGFLKNGNFNMGTQTPHVVFNYLDYLLWKNRASDAEEDFAFEFRNSVEHWYPQNRSKDSGFEKWADENRFGNLCLLPGNENSLYSNRSPMNKKDDFGEKIKKGSLKLRDMAEKTIGNEHWKEFACAEHEERMLQILKDACVEMENSFVDDNQNNEPCVKENNDMTQNQTQSSTSVDQDLVRFKNLLEYFVAHVTYCQRMFLNNKRNGRYNLAETIGYETYLADHVGDNGVLEPREVNEWKVDARNSKLIHEIKGGWDTFGDVKIRMVVKNHFGGNYATKKCFLDWGGWRNVNNEWNEANDKIVQLIVRKNRMESHEHSDWAESMRKSVEDLGLFDGLSPNESLAQFFEAYMNLG